MAEDFTIKIPAIKKYEFKLFGCIPIFSRETTITQKFDYKEIAERVSIDIQEALEKRLKS